MLYLHYLKVLSIALPLHAIAEPFNVCFEDVQQRPWTHPDGGVLNLDFLHLAGKESHEQFVFIPNPGSVAMKQRAAAKLTTSSVLYSS